MKSLKTPLRYPGGKSRACEKMGPYFPDLRNYDEFREPFLGGGSVAIHITKKYPDLKIWVNDLYSPLVIFWQQLQMFGTELKDHLLHFKSACPDPDSARGLFDISKTILNDPKTGDFERAVRFYIVNKCSFSGLTESSSFSPPSTPKSLFPKYLSANFVLISCFLASSKISINGFIEANSSSILRL